ncbi:MAG: DCC1-like thiol-disulfide oxidoreductase family protein [Verrucomicrobiota bacterium]
MVQSSAGGPVLLFDGECGLCTALAGWALRRGRGAGLCVAPLQGATAQALLRALGLPTADFDTLVFVRDRARPEAGHALRSDGALAVLAVTGGSGRVCAAVLRVIPRGWRDAGYGCVARVRKRLFGGPRPLNASGDDARRLLP